MYHPTPNFQHDTKETGNNISCIQSNYKHT